MRRLSYDEIEKLYDAGFTLSECERLSGIRRTTIQGYFRRTGKKMRSRGTPPGAQRMSDEVIETTVRLYHDEGLSLDEVGKRLGITQRSVRHRLFVAGRPPRSISESLERAYKTGKRHRGFARK